MSPDRPNSMSHEACFALGALCVLVPLWPALEMAIRHRHTAEMRALGADDDLQNARTVERIAAPRASTVPGWRVAPFLDETAPAAE